MHSQQNTYKNHPLFFDVFTCIADCSVVFAIKLMKNEGLKLVIVQPKIAFLVTFPEAEEKFDHQCSL
jgi:hypothetical protein